MKISLAGRIFQKTQRVKLAIKGLFFRTQKIKNNKLYIKKNSKKIELKNKDISFNNQRRNVLKALGVAGVGLAVQSMIPKKAEAYIMGSTPTSNVVGVKDSTNSRINPATEESVALLLNGQSVTKITTSLGSSGVVHTPASGKRIRVYSTRFSLNTDTTSVGFRFTSGGTDYERYLSPKTGGLYGSNNHPNYVEGGVDEELFCSLVGTSTLQINIDYLEV